MAFLQPGNESVSVEAHKYTHTCIHSHMRIHPPDLADLFPSSGRRGISFLEMLILSIKKRLCSFLVERRNDDEVSQSFTPHLSYCAYFFPTFFCSYSLFPSSRIFLPTSFLFSYAPAICFPP